MPIETQGGPNIPGKSIQKGQTARGRVASAGLLEILREPESKDLPDLIADMRRDYQVELVESTMRAILASTKLTWTFKDTPEVDPRAQRVLDSFQELWDATMKNMSEAISHGRSAFEKVWEYHGDDNLHLIRKMVYLPFKETDMELEPTTGSFSGIRLTVEKESILIKPPKAWWLAIDDTELNPYGTSRFIGAPHRVWEERQKYFKLREIFMRRWVVDGGVVYAPESTTNEDGTITDNFEAVGDAYEARLAGGISIFSNKRDKDGNRLYEVDQKVTVNDPSPILSVIEDTDVEMLRAFGIPEKVLIEGASVGSFAMVTVQLIVLSCLVDEILKQFVSSYKRYVCDQVLDLNYPVETKPTLVVTWQPLTERNDNFIIELAQNIITSPSLSPLVLKKVLNLQEILSRAGVPFSPDIKERLNAMENDPTLATPTGAPAQGLPLGMAQDPLDGPSAVPPPPIAPMGRIGTLTARLDRLATRVAKGELPPSTAVHLALVNLPDPQPDEITQVKRIMSSARRAAAPPGDPPSLFMSQRNPSFFDLALDSDNRPSIQGVPRPDIFTDEVVEYLDGLFETFAEMLLQYKDGKVDKNDLRVFLNVFDDLQRDVGLATYLMGLMSPWSARMHYKPDGTVRPKALKTIDMATTTSLRSFLTTKGKSSIFTNDSLSATFTKLEEAASWLATNGLTSIDDFRTIAEQYKVDPAFRTEDVLADLNKAVEESLLSGDDFSAFKQRVSRTIQFPNKSAETLFRTQTKRAYVEGQNRIMQTPAVKRLFPYYKYSATNDTRVRDEHWDLDGVVVSADDSESMTYCQEKIKEYNCRCSFYPISEKEARRIGLKKIRNGIIMSADFPAPPQGDT